MDEHGGRLPLVGLDIRKDLLAGIPVDVAVLGCGYGYRLGRHSLSFVVCSSGVCYLYGPARSDCRAAGWRLLLPLLLVAARHAGDDRVPPPWRQAVEQRHVDAAPEDLDALGRKWPPHT